MNDFKVGDRVRIIDPINATNYDRGDIVKVIDSGISGLVIDCGNGKQDFVTPEEVEPVAPDLITIDRADLPEVLDNPNGFTVGGFGYAYDLTSSQRREHALRLLALAEFLEAREKAAEEAKAKLNKRRDELAKEVAKRACYVNYQNFTYEDHVPAAQAAINMLIELDPGHD